MSASRSTLFRITVLNWSKHNARHKRHHKYTWIANNFCHDTKLNAMPLGARWMFLGILLAAGEESNDSITMSGRQLQDLLGKGGRHTDALDMLKSFQLISYEKISPFMKERREGNGVETPTPQPDQPLPPTEPERPEKKHVSNAMLQETRMSTEYQEFLSNLQLAGYQPTPAQSRAMLRAYSEWIANGSNQDAINAFLNAKYELAIKTKPEAEARRYTLAAFIGEGVGDASVRR